MENNDTNKTKNQLPSDKISFGQLAAYGSGGIIPIALFNVAGILVGLMGNISLGLSAFWLGLILIIPRLWDALSDPIIGHFSDNTRSKWGRRRPFLLVGGLFTAFFFVLIWWIPKGETVAQWFPSEEGYQIFQLVYILVTLLLFFTAVNLFEIPHGALGMEMSNDYHDRTRLFSAKSLMGNLFAMSTPWLFALANMKFFKGTGGTEVDGMRYVSLMVAAIIIPLSIWWFLKLKEPKFQITKNQEKSDFWKDMKLVVTNKNFVWLTLTVFTLAMGFNFVSLLGSYIPIFYVFGGDKAAGAQLLAINGTVWAVVGVLAVFPLNLISPKLGKKKTLLIAITLMLIAQLSKIVCYNPNHPYLVVIPTVLLSAGMLFFFTLGSSMVGDICDEDELKTGKRSEGSYYSVFWWFIKMGTALASFVTGALIVFTLFDESQVTKVDKLQSNIDETNTFVEKWNKGQLDQSLTFEMLQTYRADALKEADDYKVLLQKELKKKKESNYDFVSSYLSEKEFLLRQNLSNTNQTITVLNQFQLNKDSVWAQSKVLFPLLMQPKLDKMESNVFEMLTYFHNKSLDTKTKNKEHYNHLYNKMSEMKLALDQVKVELNVPALSKEIDKIEGELVPLKRQTPYTLFMMRVVEIGIPALLSLFSIFFLLKYTLTEKRSMEIKELLLKSRSEAQHI
jgi:GPH family glycoside/pentoside/hexuronide:cation symporter